MRVFLLFSLLGFPALASDMNRTMDDLNVGPETPIAFTNEDFDQLIMDSKGKGLEYFLAKLKEKGPSYFEGPITQYFSESPVPASPEFPRVILKSPLSNIVIAYAQPGPDAEGKRPSPSEFLEVQRLEVGKDRRPELRLYEYNLEQDTSSQHPLRSAANPPQCARCHGGFNKEGLSEARGLFDPYNRWVGSRFGRLLSTAASEFVEYPGKGEVSAEDFVTAETYKLDEALPKTIASQKKTGRGAYRFLSTKNPAIQELNVKLGYFNETRFARTLLNPALYPLRYALIAASVGCQDIQSHHDGDYKLPAAGFPIEDYLTPQVKSKLSRSLAEVDRLQQQDEVKSEHDRDKRAYRILGLKSPPSDADFLSKETPIGAAYAFRAELQSPFHEKIVALRYLIEGVGLSMRDWAQQFDRTQKEHYMIGIFDTRSPYNGIINSGVLSDFIRTTGKRDPKVLSFLPRVRTKRDSPSGKWDSYKGDRQNSEYRWQVCQDLKTASLAALAQEPLRVVEPCEPPDNGFLELKEQIKPLQKVAEDEKAQALAAQIYPELRQKPALFQAVASCIQCHHSKTPSGEEGPYLPFDQPGKLTESQLRKIRYRISSQSEKEGKARMPENRATLEETEQADLMSALRTKRGAR